MGLQGEQSWGSQEDHGLGMRPKCQWSVEGHVLEADRMRTQGNGCGERGEDQEVTWEPCFTGRVISGDRDSVCRNIASWEQAGMMPARVCLWNCRNFKDLSYRDI